MKNIIIKLLIICGAVLLAPSCFKECEIKKPKGVKPIDWENYNDIYTVFWNCRKLCSEVNGKDKWACDEGLKDIKLYGWINQCAYNNPSIDPNGFAIIDNEAYTFECNGAVGTRIYVQPYNCSTNSKLVDSLKIKFEAANLTKKCYINGKLYYAERPDNGCCDVVPAIVIYSTNDIYFEEAEL